MKTIKFSLITMFFFFTLGGLSAQEYKTTVQNTQDGRLILKDFNGELPIEGYNGTEIIISSTSERFTPPDRARGLTAVFPSGTDNTGIGLDIQKNGNIVTVQCLLPFSRNGHYTIKVPDNMALELTSGCERSNDVSVKNMKNEIDIETCHDIDLQNVSGPLVLSSISGDITISYSNINTTKSTSISSVSGDIDITMPLKAAVNLELSTINGGFYSDFDFSDSSKDLKRVGGNELKLAMNGGGIKYSITAVSGNIYLRKGK
jgi:lia operon protein LiaG